MAQLRSRSTRHPLTGRAIALSLGAALTAATTPAPAAEVTRVVSALDPGKKLDVDVGLTYWHDSKSAAVKREFQSQLSPGKTELVKDLRYDQSRDTIALRADFGILWDLGLHLELPIVVSDSRRLAFDQDLGSDCVFPNDPSGLRPSCVNEQNSSLLRDGILPGFGKPTYGFDARSGKPFGKPSKTVFAGPDRNGIEYLALGATWAIFNQVRDDAKPTWTVTFDTRLDVGTDMRYDAAKPGGNTGVGRGYHQLYWATFVSKRLRHFEPYFGAYYLMPLRTSGSPFEHYAPGSQSNVNPPQVGGIMFGAEHIVWENAEKQQKVFLEYRGRIEGRFEGREHSELWEALAGSSACRTDPSACRKDIDQDLNRDGKGDPFPGITDIETYGVFGGDLGLGIQPARSLRFHGTFGLALEQPHFITFADAGSDLNKDGKVDTDSPTESNPVYREIFDLPGRRFRVDQTQIWRFFLSAAFLF